MVAPYWQLQLGWWCVPYAILVAVSLRRHGLVLLMALGLLAGLLGVARGTTYVYKRAVYQRLAGQQVVLVGSAMDDAVYGRHSQMSFDMRDAQTLQPVRAPLLGSLQIAGFGATMIYKGDVVKVQGKLFPTRGNSQARISYATLTVLSHHTSPIDTVRRQFAAGVQSALPEPVASFALGILVGQRNTLPTDISEQFTMVGLTHIIAVSGYNLTIIMKAMAQTLQKRSKYQYLLGSCLLVGLFLLLAGSSPSLVRASVVCGLGLAAWYYGRTLHPVVLLLVAAAITVVANPLYAWGNVSWMLSFLAFFGVLVVGPIITKRLYGTREPKLIASIVLESLAAEMMTLPYVLCIFGQMSLVATIANVLVVALVPLAMLLGLCAGLAGMFVAPLAGWIAWPGKLLMTYMLDVAHLLSKVPHAFLRDIVFPWPYMLVCYALMAVILWIAWRKARQNGIITDNIANKWKEHSTMSGHSKWSTIKREKGAKDAARGALFTKLGNAIALAARTGADPEMNFSLRLAIDKAKAANMPTANIQRSIDRGSGKLGGDQIQEVMYEGYGAGGVAVLVECATDNLNRTYPEVKLAFAKHGGNIAEKGAVAFQFERKGTIRVKGTGDDLMMQALDAGAEDMQEEDGESVIYTDPKELAKVREALQAAGIEITEAELTFIPNNTVEITDEATAGKIMRMMDALEASDDVTNTYVNFDIPEELIK